MIEFYWKLLFFLILIVYGLIRVVYASKYSRKNVIKESARIQEKLMLAVLSVGMIILPVLYIITPIFDPYSISLPEWLRWTGVVIAIPSVYLFYLTHRALDKYWSPVPEIQKDQHLVTSGPYKYIRHPMYTQMWLWFISQFLILSNWIAGMPGLVIWIAFYFLRVNREEKLLLEQFGDEYRDYIKNTGKIIPKIN